MFGATQQPFRRSAFALQAGPARATRSNPACSTRRTTTTRLSSGATKFRRRARGGLAPFIKKNTQGSLSRNLDRAITAWNSGDEAAAQSFLAAMVATVKSSLSSFSRCSGGVCRNSPGEIIARAESASFMVCQAGGGTAHDCGRELN